MNIIIGESNECNAKLVKYVAQFGSVTAYSYLSETYDKTNLEKHLQEVIQNMTLSNTTLSIAIYNMYEETHLKEIYDIFKAEFDSFENKKLVNFNFEVDKFTDYAAYTNMDNTVEFVGEELNNVDTLKTEMEKAFSDSDPAATPKTVFTNVEIELYIYIIINIFIFI